jgi:two-component system, NtrC family, sensor kinase
LNASATFSRAVLPAYAMALATSFLVAAIRLAALRYDILQDVPYLLFAIPIVIGAWMGGWGPGLFATAVGLLLIVGVLSEPGHWATRAGLIGIAMFLTQGLIISALGATRMRALDRIAALARDLERRVDARTAELRHTKERLEREAVERERASDELRAITNKLESSNRELQDFASVASHDLQEPLRKIRAFGDRLTARHAQALGPEGADYIRRMQNAAGRMQVLIDDLLTLSRVQSKAQPFQEVDLKQVAVDVLSDLETRIADAEASVNIGELPRIDADPTQMRQLLQNLIGNALKFRRPGLAPRVDVDATVEPASSPDPAGNGHIARITVADNGIGFEERFLDRIFTVFQRLHGRNEYEGTGIGLAVCRRIAERHGGSITARSIPGEGSTFIVTLPVHQQGTAT